MAAPKPLCIATDHLYPVHLTGCNPAPTLVEISSTFDVVRGVKTNRVRERSLRRCNNLRLHFGATGERRW